MYSTRSAAALAEVSERVTMPCLAQTTATVSASAATVTPIWAGEPGTRNGASATPSGATTAVSGSQRRRRRVSSSLEPISARWLRNTVRSGWACTTAWKSTPRRRRWSSWIATWLFHSLEGGGRVRLHAADRPRQPPPAADLELAAAARRLRAVHLLRRHVLDLVDQRRVVRRGGGDRAAVAVPALERRAVPDAAAQYRAGVHVRSGAYRARRLDPPAAGGPGARLQDAVGDPVRDARRQRARRRRVRTGYDGAGPAGHPEGRDPPAARAPARHGRSGRGLSLPP